MAKARPITELDPQASTAQNARIIIRERLADLDAYTPYIGSPDHLQQLHDLRIATKRVRYSLEIFAKVLPATSQSFAEELAKLQDELGTLHDSEVMLTLLRQLLQGDTTSGQTVLPEPEKALLSPDMLARLLPSSRTSPLSEKERRGLSSFLQRQEQRRAASYLLFRQHWEELERAHFREEILAMLTDERGNEATTSVHPSDAEEAV